MLSVTAKIEGPEPEMPKARPPFDMAYSLALSNPGMRLFLYGSAITSTRHFAASFLFPVWEAWIKAPTLEANLMAVERGYSTGRIFRAAAVLTTIPG